jgi:hypothetical protein
MKKSLITAACLVFLSLLVQSAVFAHQTTSTGDRKLDAMLGTINVEERGDPDGFVVHLSRSQNVPEAEIRLARTRYGLSAGETFMATVLSSLFGKPVDFVAQEYSRNRGQGWGVMAMNRGIKPGSWEFKRMKANARGSLNNMQLLAKAKKNKQNRELKVKNQGQGQSQGQGQGQGKGKKK